MITLRRIDPVQAIGRAVYRDGVAVGGGPASSMAKELPVGRTAYWLRSVRRGHHFVNQYPEERDLQNDLMPQYPCHHIVKQT